jgi:hypothetical protein
MASDSSHSSLARWPGESSQSISAHWSLRALFALVASRSIETSKTYRSSRTRFAQESLRAIGALVSLVTRCAGRTL